MRKSHRKGVAVCVVLLVFALALGAFVIWWFFGASYAFDTLSRKEGKIPLEDGFCPQGICPMTEEGYSFAVSGYRSGASRLYLTGETTKYVTLKKGEKELTTHFGGVTRTEDYFYVASGKSVVRVAVADVLAAENGSAVAVKDSFSVADMGVAYCYYDEASGLLFAGEFYRKGNYETAQAHRITVKEGEIDPALVYAYRLDESKEGGIASPVPEKVIAVPALVQGIAVYEGGIALSTSYGLPDSNLYFHKNILNEETEDTYTIGETAIPLYKLGSDTLEKTVLAPCMSEEIFAKDGRLYVLFESKADKYKLFVRRQTDEICSIPLS